MKKIILSFVALLTVSSVFGAYNKNVEKSLKKLYREITYLPHNDCYLVMSKSDRDFFGLCSSDGKEIIPPTYKKIAFEKTENGESLAFALNPNFKAPSQGNIIYSVKRGKIMDIGRNEPQYVPGGYITSYSMPIYNLNGAIVMDCNQTAIQPLRRGTRLIGYRVGTRSYINNKPLDRLIICDNSFNQLFVLDGPSYMWKVEETSDSEGTFLWKCIKNFEGKELETSLYTYAGNPVSENPDLSFDSNSHRNTIAQLPQDNPVQNSSKPISNQTTASEDQNSQNIYQNPNLKPDFTDVDNAIPSTPYRAENTFAVIIANEEYEEADNVQFALNDGRTVAKYMERTLGVPKNNIKLVENATFNNIRRQINWLRQIADAFGPETKIIFYYAGHGMPDEQSKQAYLMPTDGYNADMSTNISLNDLYRDLEGLNVGQVVVLLDACFSGSQRNEKMLVSSRGIKIKAQTDRPQGKLVVFSAAQADETAYPLIERQHGLFTYYLLRKLKDSGATLTLGELSESIVREVKKASLISNGKLQTPTTIVSPQMEGIWKNLTL